jgi:hypothetical protein
MALEKSPCCFKNVKHCGNTHEKYGVKILSEDVSINETKDKEAVPKS